MRIHEIITESPLDLLFKKQFSVKMPMGHRGNDVRDIQQALEALGYTVGPPGLDGIIGPYTSGAIKKFQTDNGLEVTGMPTIELVAKLNDQLKLKPGVLAKLKPSTDEDVPSKSGGAANIALKEPGFAQELEKVANNLGVSSKSLMAIMRRESNLNPKAVNKFSKATGLIQFIPSTARALGTTTKELYDMSAVEQLKYVEKYLKQNGVKPGMDAGDIYLAVFMPAAMGKHDNYVLGAKGSPGRIGTIYAQNNVLDVDNNGVITVADVKNAVQAFV